MKSKQIKALDKAQERLDARRTRVMALEKVRQRKNDARRKIIIGAVMMKRASEDEVTKVNILNIISGLNERDQKLFDNYFED